MPPQRRPAPDAPPADAAGPAGAANKVVDPGTNGVAAPAQDEYARMLGEGVPFETVDRFAFYDRVRSPDVGVVIATGDERLYGNLLLTVGLR